MTPTQWLEAMRSVWLSQKPADIAELLSENLHYYESPTDEQPLRTVDDVVKEWETIKYQDIEYVDIDVLHEDNNVCFAQWRFKELNKPEHIGSYFLKLDESGKCIEFRQWWNVKED